ncbi:MAG: nitroreductase family protein [Candidatus Nanoarchaeia archaeon]|nr:nitroreductase family protein [Candidatus Nanoarchaeia archaeon]
MDVFKAIKTRRSVRRFISKMVPEKELVQVLESARWAPSAGNVQDGIFIIIRNSKQKEEIAKACMEQHWMSKAPILIAVCSSFKRLGILYGKEGLEKYTYMDCSAAIQNMMLAAHNLGLATCWVGGMFDHEKINRILDIPSDEAKVISIIALGYPAEKPPAPIRKDLREMVFFDEYFSKLKKKPKIYK